MAGSFFIILFSKIFLFDKFFDIILIPNILKDLSRTIIFLVIIPISPNIVSTNY